ncbi:MAG: OsmC family protein [bacterium]
MSDMRSVRTPGGQIPTVAEPGTLGFSLSTRLYDNYEQIVDFKLSGVAVLGLDECPPTCHGWGPSPAHLIGAALGACLAGRLLSRLRERGVDVRDMRTDVRGTFASDSGGRRRIARIAVHLVPIIQSPADVAMPKADALLRESLVAKSIAPGIDIELAISPEAPAEIRRTAGASAVAASSASSAALALASPCVKGAAGVRTAPEHRTPSADQMRETIARTAASHPPGGVLR